MSTRKPQPATPRASDVPPVTAANLAHYESARSVAEYTREEGLRPLEAELVAEFFPQPPASVLDLGCGAGRTTVGLAALGYRPTAIDLSPALLAEARRRFPGLDFREMDATRLDFPRESFDAAFFSYNGLDCIHPVEQRIECLRQVFGVLRPGGTFLLSSHNWVGALWSGGYFYPLGYWHAARFWARQVKNPLVFQGYLLYPDADGPQFLYSAPPGATERQLESVGFEVLALVGYSRELPPGRVRRRSQHVHFVAKKPT